MSQPEHIRCRAGMYIGRLGNGTCPNDGIYTMLQEALHYMVNEFCEGYGKRIEIRMEDKQTVVIRDYGRGMCFEERYAKSRRSPKMMVDMLTGVGMDAVNALSSCMDICIYRKGIVTERHYEEGMLLGEWTEKTNRKDGISISFTPDENIFGPFQFQEDIVFALLRNISYLNVGLEIVYDRIRMKSTEGMAEMLADKMRYKGEYLYPIMHFKNERVDLAITHSRDKNGACYSFVNGLCTHFGEAHLYSLKEAVASVMLELYPSDGFVPEDVCSGLRVAISIYLEQPMFESANKGKLASLYVSEDNDCTIKEYMREFLKERLKGYLMEHPEICLLIFKRMSMCMEHRKSGKLFSEEWNYGYLFENKVDELREKNNG
jgi:topoisomerase-4 subunit B